MTLSSPTLSLDLALSEMDIVQEIKTGYCPKVAFLTKLFLVGILALVSQSQVEGKSRARATKELLSNSPCRG